MLRVILPAWPEVVADHVTLASGKDVAAPPQISGEIVGRANDGCGVEALVVAVNGSTRRPDGGTFHITWSLDHQREARESNDVLARKNWSEMAFDEALILIPATW